MDKLKELEKNIRTINPEITDDILNLLYEYIVQRLNQEFKTFDLLNIKK